MNAKNKAYLFFLLRLALTVLLITVMFSKVFLLTQSPDNAMFPSVKNGDLLIAFRLQKEFTKNDIVIFTAEGKRHVLRILALGNDVVQLSEEGILSVNGAEQSGEILFPTYAEGEKALTVRVPEDHVFVLGDYRTQAEDSRQFGTVPVEAIEGKVITLLRRQGL